MRTNSKNGTKHEKDQPARDPGIRMFAVTAKCGHVGRNRYMPIEFAISAANASEAASLARKMPRVKHDHPKCILGVREIDEAEGAEIIFRNSLDPYLRVSRRKEQEMVLPLIEHRLVEEPDYVRPNERYRKARRAEENKARFCHPSGERLRDPKHYANRYAPTCAAGADAWDEAA